MLACVFARVQAFPEDVRFWPMHGPFPREMTGLLVEEALAHGRYGIVRRVAGGHAAHGAVHALEVPSTTAFAAEEEDYRNYCTAPVDLWRPGRAITSATYVKYVADCVGPYLGFCRYKFGVPDDKVWHARGEGVVQALWDAVEGAVESAVEGAVGH